MTIDPYEVYVTTFAKLRSGKVLDESDFHHQQPPAGRPLPLDLDARLAVLIALDDAGRGDSPPSANLRSRAKFNEAHKKLVEAARA